MSRTLASLLSLVLIFLVTVPASLAQMLGSPVYFSGRMYPMTLSSEGSPLAGIKGRSYEYISQATTNWTALIADIQDGNLLFSIHPLQLPGTQLPLEFRLTWNAVNAELDIGLGKGWTSNLHSTITEDLNQNLLLVTGTGSKLFFVYDSNTQSYQSPPGFTGKIEKLPNGSYRIASLDGSSQTFSSNGKLGTISPSCGDATLSVSYDGNGRPTNLTDTLSSRALTLTWDQNGYLSEVEDMLENTWAFAYNQDQHLITLTQPGQNTPPSASFSYHGTTHLLETHTDFEGYDYSFTYYPSGAHEGKLESWADSLGNTWALDYDTSVQGYASKTTVTDGAGIDTDYYFGATSLALEKASMGTAPDDIYHVFTYNQDGWLTSSTNPMGFTTNYSYDLVGHLTGISYPPATPQSDPFQVVFTYTPPNSLNGKLTESSELISGNTWNTTTMTYTDQNAPCLPSSITNALGETITISYNSHAQPTQVIYPTGTALNPSTGTVSYSYHPTSYRLSQVLGAENNATTVSYNANGSLIGIISYETTVMAGHIKHNILIDYDETNQKNDINELVSDIQLTTSYDKNGADTQSSQNGCIQGRSFGYVNQGQEYRNASFVNQFKPIYLADYKQILYGLGHNSLDLIYIPPQIPIYNPQPHSITDSQGYTSIFAYHGNWEIKSETNHLNLSAHSDLDSFGRIDTITRFDGTVSNYTFNKASQAIDISRTSSVDFEYKYDDCGRLTEKNNSLGALVLYDYNLRGNLTSTSFANYSYDILGRKTQNQYVSGGGDSWSYTRDGLIASKNQETYSYDKLGNIENWNSNGADGAVSYSYTGTHGSKVLGLPSATTGSGNIGSYAFTYNPKYLLHSMTDTSKTNQTYTYNYSSAKQITELLYPNQTTTNYIYDNKQLDSIQVRQLNVNPPMAWLTTDSTYNQDGQRTDYSFSVTNGQGGAFAESHEFSYDSTGRMTSIDYQNSQRTVDLSYDVSTGRMNELDYSDLGTYTLSHDAAGQIISSTYPNLQQEIYTYQGLMGRISKIQYPGNRSLSFVWNAKNQITEAIAINQGVSTNFYFNWNTRGKLASYLKIEGGITTEQWYFFHSRQGLEKAQRLQYGVLNLTMNFTTDPKGRILSMTHTPSGGGQGFTGEVYFHYDNAGNTSLLTNASGAPLASFQYDLLSGAVLNEWNPLGIQVKNLINGEKGAITMSFFANTTTLTLGGFGKKSIVQNSIYAILLNEGSLLGTKPPTEWPRIPGFGDCPCPEFSLLSSRPWSADEIREVYDKACGGEEGIRAVLKEVFGEDLDDIPEDELEKIIKRMMSRDGFGNNWIDHLINSLEENGPSHIFFGGMAGGKMGDSSPTYPMDSGCWFFLGLTDGTLTAEQLLDILKTDEFWYENFVSVRFVRYRFIKP